MRPDILESIYGIGNIVCNLVGHSLLKIVVKISAEDMGVITDTAIIIANPVHPGRLSTQIKQNRNGVELAVKVVRQKLDTLCSAIHNHPLLLRIHYYCFHACQYLYHHY